MALFRRKRKRTTPQKSGGVAFFCSYVFLALLSIMNTTLVPHLWDGFAAVRASRFAAGWILGIWLAHQFIRGHASVLIHEYKHAILSGFAGNKWKGMNVKKNSGHFEYAYSKENAGYNAFIALAPYFLPLFTVPSMLLVQSMIDRSEQSALFLLGICYGIDCLLNVRDISPIQTDLTEITGGYWIALGYVVLINLVIFTILLAWVLQGVNGLSFLLYGLWSFVVHLASYYRGPL